MNLDSKIWGHVPISKWWSSAQKFGNRYVSPKCGFTLIELLAVIALIALLSSVAIPRVSTVLGVNLRTGATKVAGYLQGGYEQAVMRHQKIRIRFDLFRNTYWAEQYQDLPLIPLMDQNTKLDDVINQFEELEETPPLTPEEQLFKEQERYKKTDLTGLKPQALPSGIRFKGVYLASEGKVIEEQAPWVDFSPSGFGSKAIVYVSNKAGDVFSIIIPPLGGRARVEKGEIRPDDV